jgi:hypothetical protein
MAAAAGMQTGAIVSVSDGTSVDGTVPFAVPAAASRIGDFSQFLLPSTLFGVLTSPVLIGSPQPVVIGSPQPACSLTVQFTLHP